MTASILGTFDFSLPAELEADAPPEVRGSGRDDVAMLVARRATSELWHRRFIELPDVLQTGDIVVVNVSRTVPAALSAVAPDGTLVEVHVSSPMPGADVWSIELRQPDGAASIPFRGGQSGWLLRLDGGGSAELLGRAHRGGRLWLARLEVDGSPVDYLERHGHPIRYGYVRQAWPLETYQNVYATVPGSAELASAGRAFTPELITRLVAAGIDVAPLVLHCGVASLEDHEPPYAEWYEVPAATARRINSARAAGGRVVAVGTTVVRALETVADATGVVHPGSGWTEVVITPARPVRAIDGLLTGWHEPRASHLAMLEAITGTDLLRASYDAALQAGYHWHEFGDLHLILP